MEIIVCIKQVPDTVEIKLDPKTNTLVREGVRSIINPFDLFAIEEAIRLKENHGGKVTVITMGPPQAKTALKSAIAMGADSGFLVSSRAFAGSDTWATSYTLSQAIKTISDFDLIICGKQALDGDTAQVGPGIAAYLDIPQIAFVGKIENIENNIIIANRETETGHETIKTSLPALITVNKEINVPRYESFVGKMNSKRIEIPTLNEKDIKCNPENLGLEGSPTEVVKTFPPSKKHDAHVLEGNSNNIEIVVNEIKEMMNT